MTTTTQSRPADGLESELAQLLVDALHLECAPADIDPAAPLYGGDGLGLDSVDILEASLAVSQKYGMDLRSDGPDDDKLFATLRTLAAYVAQHRQS
jgi:acyl carrier protein